MKVIDLTVPFGMGTPAWPTYEPLQVKYSKRLAPNGANGQLLTHSNHVGTHLDGEIHFFAAGKDIASLDFDFLVHDAVVVDEPHHHFGRRTISAAAEYADPLRRISLARLSSRTSCSNSFSRCRSSVVRPVGRPPTRSACCTHRCRLSGVHPIFSEIERIAAHCESWSAACSRTIRTALSRTSVEYRLVVFLTPSSRTVGSPAIPGRFTPGDPGPGRRRQ